MNPNVTVWWKCLFPLARQSSVLPGHLRGLPHGHACSMVCVSYTPFLLQGVPRTDAVRWERCFLSRWTRVQAPLLPEKEQCDGGAHVPSCPSLSLPIGSWYSLWDSLRSAIGLEGNHGTGRAGYQCQKPENTLLLLLWGQGWSCKWWKRHQAVLLGL